MTGEMTTYASNGDTAEGYLAAGGRPGVIVIQEWWGLNDQIKGVADRFATEGFTAFAPDLYHGEKTAEPDEAMKMMMSFDIERAARDVRGAARFLVAETGGRVGVIGFCMGGQLAILTATVAPAEVGAAVDMYGVPTRATLDFSKLTAPVLALFGAEDDSTPDDAKESLRASVESAGATFSTHTYPGAGHAFMNEQRPDAYRAEAAADAWSRILTFFRENLAG